MIQKQEFMFVFRYEPSNDFQPTEAQINEMHQQWGAFIGNIAIQEKLVSTHQLGFEGVQIMPDETVVDGFNISNKQMLSGNMIVNASTFDEAVAMAKNCPILRMGGTVEVRNILPM